MEFSASIISIYSLRNALWPKEFRRSRDWISTVCHDTVRINVCRSERVNKNFLTRTRTYTRTRTRTQTRASGLRSRFQQTRRWSSSSGWLVVTHASAQARNAIRSRVKANYIDSHSPNVSYHIRYSDEGNYRYLDRWNVQFTGIITRKITSVSLSASQLCDATRYHLQSLTANYVYTYIRTCVRV